MRGAPLLLGFDSRSSKPPDWDESRKRAFLLRLDVSSPLSIDAMVWPSVFELHREPRPAFVGIFDDLWMDLGALRERLTTAETLKDARVAAFGRMTAVASAEELAALETLLRGVHPDGTPGDLPASIANPAAVEPGWTFLGYDVADLWGLSGLMNCGFGPEEDVEALRLYWGPKLNRWHLFDRLGDAREFKELSNRRVQEHAPFYVDGIWLVDGTINPSAVFSCP
jgi:hypothetical protein